MEPKYQVIAVIAALIVVLPIAIVIPLGWLTRRVRGIEVQNRISMQLLFGVAVAGGLFVFLALVQPWLALLFLICMLAWGLMDMWRMPADKKIVFYESLRKHQEKPLVRLMDFLACAMMISIIAMIAWNMIS